MSTLIWCLLIAGLLPIAAKAPVVYFQNRDKGYDNRHPRAQQQRLTGAGARAVAGHYNAYEAFHLFIEKSTGDYIFHIDADEYPHETLLEQLKQIIEMNDGVDLIWIPRVNTIEGMTQEHIQKWSWRVTENGWVNYPDYQARVFRRDKSIRWTRPLHELITGCKTYAHLPPHEELSLYHPKTIQKQEQQNMFYIDNFNKDLLVRRGNE